MDKRTKSWMKQAKESILEQGLILLIPIMVIRGFEVFVFDAEAFQSIGSAFRVYMFAIFKEIIFLTIYLLTFGIIYSQVKRFSRILYTFLIAVSSILLIVIYLATSQYYYTADLLLDHVILYFNFNELLEIAGTESGRLTGEYFWFYVVSFSLLILALIFRKTILKTLQKGRLTKVILIGGLTVICVHFILANPTFKKEHELNSISKPKYLFSHIIDNLFFKVNLDNLSEKELYLATKSFRSFMEWENNVHQTKYPFVKTHDDRKNSLNKYFTTFDQKPNLVLVFCEGLSSTFSGQNAHLGSYTPFLDSLYKQGLYWPNAISNTDRTHGVFANVLASLPHGFERGILNLKSTFPQHFSIPKSLASNGYHASFLYGGWGYYDNFEPFLRKNYVSTVWDKTYMEKNNIIEARSKEEDFTWGIHDKEMVDLYFAFKDSIKNEPFFDLFVTLSLHSPFDIPEKEKYVELARNMSKNKPNGKEVFDKSSDILASIVYQDEALKQFMKTYEKRPEFENTVFLFVGDHNVVGLPMRSELDAHSVPLLIYSPQLKESKQFKDIVAHTDVPQSILTLFEPYLENQANIEFNHWVGEGLSTKNQVASQHPIFIGSFNGDVNGVISDNHILLNNQLYKIENHLNLSKVDDEKLKQLLQKQLKNYEIMNHFTIKQNRLLLPKDTLAFPNEDVDFYFPVYDE
ncbi:hypothetical protein CW751_04785 [Brumimicrobium salinarum]|uniref:Sulfatase N-terminal domain-containing protein n=1 Tax=Brumimicrobium salinarum TaxID=2058658 RepID=A0A2I0R467_9FLAO|nr:alkaline phosphatase family protein [Brumimicrobium salinarum]PKR81375.1 hypothetical protein CW751_04785 [Brumimicrobium salinarum]